MRFDPIGFLYIPVMMAIVKLVAMFVVVPLVSLYEWWRYHSLEKWVERNGHHNQTSCKVRYTTRS